MFNKFKSSAKVELCTLSGTNEIGRNCTYVEYNNQILVIDAGLSFPDQEMYGIDYLIPNINTLKKKKQKIKALLITHGHQDHIGAIPYIIKDLGFPTIYAGPFAAALIKEKLYEFGLETKVKIIEIRGSTKFRVGDFGVTYISNTHSIPDSFSIYLETPEARIFLSGDYKMEVTQTDYKTLESIRGKVDVALLESTNAYEEGKARPESEVALTLERIISNAKGRVIVAAFASLVSRLTSVIEIAKKTNRKIVLAGRSLNLSIGIALDYKYIDAPKELFIKEGDISKYKDNQLIFLTTGSQAERYSSLNRISLAEHKYIKAKPGDLVIMSSSEIPENVGKIERMTDRLIRQGVDLVKSKEEDVHSSGHGMQEDMKMLYEILEPKYIIPIHGSLTFRYQNKKNYVKWGHNPDNVLLTEDGQQWIYDNNNLKRGTKIESKPILIDGLGVGDIGDIVLKDRKQLATYGMFCIVLNLSTPTQKLLGRPRFISRGFIYMKASQKILKEIENIVVDCHRQWFAQSKKSGYQTDKLIEAIEHDVAKYIFKKTEREPIILPVII
ncbi:MAG TPA: ribonuclease J [Candidatus Dojkabacteria bacterium]|nr:ribonuclease J [Candidatus Dojkabacteria bacterium]